MLINAQPRVVSVSRSFTPLNKPRKSQGLFEMPTNNLNSSCAATSAVSGALTNEAWDWGISSVDQENYTVRDDVSFSLSFYTVCFNIASPNDPWPETSISHMAYS